jgi:transposase
MADRSSIFWVGIDVSKAKFDVAIFHRGDDRKKWRSMKVETFNHDQKGTDQFLVWLARQQGICGGLCAESTGVYSQLLAMQIAASKKRPADLPALSIVNPRFVKGTGESLNARDKTDANDARVIAIHGVDNEPVPAAPRSPEWIHLQALAKMRDGTIADLTRAKNQLESSLDAACRRLIKEDIGHFERKCAKIQKQIDELIDSCPQIARDVELLESVPYIGRVIAVALLAHFGDLRTWSRRQIVSYAGLYPRVKESGSSVHEKPHLGRHCSKRVRCTMYMASLNLIHRDVGYNRSVLRMREHDKRPSKLCVGAAMRKMLLVARAVVVSGKPYNPALAA